MNFKEYRSIKHFSGLDSLRCFSVLAVVWHHTGSQYSNLVYPILSKGYMGVTMFFVISGFLITTLLLREFRSQHRIDYRKFMVRRALRIFPLYYAVLALYIVLVALLETESEAARDFWNNLPYFLSYTSNFFVPLTDGRVIFYFSWSLATEEQFYLVWPLMIAFLKPKLAALSMVALTLFIAINLVLAITDNIVIANVPLAICLGAILAIVVDSKLGFYWITRLLSYAYVPAVMIITLLLTMNSPIKTPLVIPLLMTLLLASLILNPSSVVVRFLSGKLITFVGKISYGIYLLHQLCAKVIEKLLVLISIETSGWLFFVLTSIAAIMAATVSFYLFESYFLKLKPRYSV